MLDNCYYYAFGVIFEYIQVEDSMKGVVIARVYMKLYIIYLLSVETFVYHF
jgi:hypothetical protein